MTWGIPVQSFVFLGLMVFELEPMYATSDRRTDGRTDADHRLMPPPLRGGGIIMADYAVWSDFQQWVCNRQRLNSADSKNNTAIPLYWNCFHIFQIALDGCHTINLNENLGIHFFDHPVKHLQAFTQTIYHIDK